MISRLLRPLDYIRVEHPAKTKYDVTVPAVFTIICLIIIWLLPEAINVFQENGLIEIVSELLQILTGFYIASLAAVATFNKEGMDNSMPGAPLTLKVRYKGKDKTDNLTRRRFLCLMFGYLALLSFFIYFFGKISVLLIPNLKIIIPFAYQSYAKVAFLIVYLFLVFNLLITTLLSLFYMVDRIHRSDVGIKKIEK